MPWLVLLVSAVFEAVWATALGMSIGFREPGPTAVFAAALTASMLGLGWAARSIPIGTAYAVWVGIGATLTVLWGFVTKQENPNVARILLLILLVGSVVGLKAVS